MIELAPPPKVPRVALDDRPLGILRPLDFLLHSRHSQTRPRRRANHRLVRDLTCDRDARSLRIEAVKRRASNRASPQHLGRFAVEPAFVPPGIGAGMKRPWDRIQ